MSHRGRNRDPNHQTFFLLLLSKGGGGLTLNPEPQTELSSSFASSSLISSASSLLSWDIPFVHSYIFSASSSSSLPHCVLSAACSSLVTHQLFYHSSLSLVWFGCGLTVRFFNGLSLNFYKQFGLVFVVVSGLGLMAYRFG